MQLEDAVQSNKDRPMVIDLLDRADPAYALRFKVADEEVTELLQTEAHERANRGTETGVYYKGSLVATVREKSDLLLIFLLKARRPDLYRERWDVKTEHSLGDAVTAEIIAGLSDEKLAQLQAATDTMKAIVGGPG